MNDLAENDRGEAGDRRVADNILKRWEQAKGERSAWLGLWQEMAQYVRPSRDPAVRSASVTVTPRLSGFEQLFDSTAIHANMVLASGCMSRLTPAQSPWFKYESPGWGAPDRVKQWFDKCTEIAHLALATSNFYTELHELYLDRGAFGTACFHADAGTDHPLMFHTSDTGTYALLNGANGQCDTVFRELRLDARQAAQLFGEKALPEELSKCLLSPTDAINEKHEFVHAVYPRADHERDGAKMDGRNMAVASVHVHVKSRTIVRNSGYNEMCSFGSRYLRWGESSYGFCPAWQCLPDARQLNDMQRNLDVLAEVAAFPRMLLPEDQEGEVDLRAMGQTFFKSADKVPRAWMTEGRYEIGMERVAMRRQSIRDAFHVELFQQWAMISKQMTAAEVNARELEKIELFSPTFTLLTTELYTPILTRVFALLLRQGVFPPPPPEIVYVNSRGRYAVPDPRVQFTSRLALALKSVRSYALNNAIARAGQMSAFPAGTSVGDNLRFDRAWRDSAMDDGLPVEWITDEEDVARTRQARAQAAQEAAQMEQAKALAEGASKLATAGLIPTQNGLTPVGA